MDHNQGDDKIEQFKSKFLKSYLAGGMGSLSKRDIDALVMHLLDEQGLDDGIALKNLSNQQVSVKLKVSTNRIKSLRYEATLKYVTDNESLAKWKFLEVLASSRFDSERDRIGFIIEDAFTKNWLQGILKDGGLVFDNSFNAEIVKVDSAGLLGVLELLYDVQSVSALRIRIDATRTKSEKLTFAEIKKEFLKGAANGLGKAATSVATKSLLALVTG